MAEAYKGLTIRIGADTTDFSRKLKSLGTAISATQAGLKQMTQALRDNPQSIDAMNQKFSLLQNQTQNLNAKLGLINSMLRQMDESGMGELAAQTQNSALQARMLTDRLNQVNANLEQEHDRLAEIGKQLGIAYNKDDVRGFYEEVKSKTDMANASQKRMFDTVTQIVENVSRLRDAHTNLEKDLRIMQQIDAYKSLQRDAVALQAQLQSVYKEMSALRMAMPSQAEAQKVKVLEAAFGELEADMQATREQARAFKASLYLDPHNMEKFDKAVNAVYHQMELTAKQADNLRNRIKVIGDESGIKKVEGDLSTLQAQARTAGDKFDRINNELSETKSKITMVRQEIKSLSNNTAENAEQFRKNNERARELHSQLQRLKRDEKELASEAKKAGEAARMSQATVEMKKLEGELDKTNAKMERFTNASKQARTSMLNGLRDMATSLGATLAPMIATVSSKVISSADTIDSAYRDMRKTVEGTEEQFESLKNAAIEFSRTHPVSADTILEIEAIGGQLGIVVDELEEFAHVVSNLDIATNMDAEDIALDLGKMRNIFSELNWNTEKFGDSLVRLGNNTPALESDIMNISMRFAGMSAILSVLPDEVLAIATAASATGQKADAAGGSLQRTFGRIEGAVSGVSDAMRNLDDLTEEEIGDFENAKDKLQDYADIAGMSAEEFAKLWSTHTKVDKSITGLSTDVTGTTAAFTKFVEGLKRVKDEGGSVDAALMKLGITGVRDRQLLEGLTNTTKVLNDSLLMSSDAWNGVADQWGAAGDAAREAEKKAQGFSGKLATLKNIVQTLGSAFGDKLVPLLDVAIAALQQATVLVDNMPAPMAQMLALLAATAIALPPILRNYAQFSLTMEAVAASSVKARLAQEATNKAMEKGLVGVWVKKTGIKSIGDIGAAFQLLGEKAKKMVPSLTAAKAAMAGLAVAGVAVLAVGLKALIDREIEFYKATDGLKDVFNQTGVAMGNFNAKVTPNVYTSVRGAVDEYIKHLASLRDELLKMGKDAANSAATLRKWGDLAKANLDVSADNATAVARQKLAVEQLNEQYGLGLQIVEEDNRLKIANAEGEIMVADAIEQVIDAKKRQLELQAYEAMYAKLIQEQAEAERQVVEATAAYASAQQALDDAISRGERDLYGYYVNLDEAKDNLNRAEAAQRSANDALASGQAEFDRAARAAEGASTAEDNLYYTNRNLASQIDSIADGELTKFIGALEEQGISMDELKRLNATDIVAITESWKNGTSEWVSVIKGASDRTKSEMDDMASHSHDTGWNIGMGIAEGIDAAAGIIASRARAAVGAALAAANQAAEVRSPSRKTMWTGRMIGQGYVIGMKSEQDAIERQGAILGALAVGSDAYANSASLGYLSGRAAGTFGSTTTTNNTTHDTQYILSGDIIIQSQTGNPQEIVDEIVRVFSNAQRAYGRA